MRNAGLEADRNFFTLQDTRQISQKLKIQVIKRISPDKLLGSKSSQSNKYPKVKVHNETYFIKDRPSLTLEEHVIDLRTKMIQPRTIRAPTAKERESLMFTEKCLKILSHKKRGSTSQEQCSRMKEMMDNLVDKYKKNINQSKQTSREGHLREGHLSSREGCRNVPYAKGMPNTKDMPYAEGVPYTKGSGSYNRLNSYEEQADVYRMLKSAELYHLRKEHQPQTEQQWKSRPDVTGIRMNNKLLKSQACDIKGVTCFSLTIASTTNPKASLLSKTFSSTMQRKSCSQSPSRRRIKIERASNPQFMAFSSAMDPDSFYLKKLKSLLDFLFKINYSNRIYVSLSLPSDTSDMKRYKVYIGRGNNSLLLKSLLKRRFWLEIVEDPNQQDIKFYWTQNKRDSVHQRQKSSVFVRCASDASVKQLRAKELKSPEQKEQIEMNKKILVGEDCSLVQRLVMNNGFSRPYDRNYECDVISNHLPRNSCIGSKKNLFKSLSLFYRHLQQNPFDYIPKTYSVRNPEDPEFKKFIKDYEMEPHKVWIVKPGENTNQGIGIRLSITRNVIDLIKARQKHPNGQTKTYILQSYIEKPFLYNHRKFDIRHFMLLTSVNGVLKAYWYREGYLRTSSQRFDIDDLDSEVIHLTNDAIQKNYEDYGKFERGNKLSYTEFQRYLDSSCPAKGYNFERDVVPAMKSIIVNVVKANYNVLDKNRKQSNFQVFGFDFMLDKDFKPWLIEVNFNPCLQINCPLLSRMIPVLVESSLRVGLDPLLPPTGHYPTSKRFTLCDNYLKNLRYQLIFDEIHFKQTLPYNYDIEDSDQEEEQYCDDGQQIEDLVL